MSSNLNSIDHTETYYKYITRFQETPSLHLRMIQYRLYYINIQTSGAISRRGDTIEESKGMPSPLRGIVADSESSM